MISFVSYNSSLLSIRNISLEFRTRTGTVHALENISFHINPSETVGIVGESVYDPTTRLHLSTCSFFFIFLVSTEL